MFSKFSKPIKVIYEYDEVKKEIFVEKSSSLKQIKEKIELAIKFPLSSMKLFYNNSNILLNNENYKVYDFFGDIKEIPLTIEPKEFTEESYIERFAKAFRECGQIDSEKNVESIEKNSSKNNKDKTQEKEKKYLKDLVVDKTYEPTYKPGNVCNMDQKNSGTYICLKCRLLWCKHCMKFEVHKDSLVELDFLQTYLGMRRKAYAEEIDESILKDKHFSDLEKIDFVLNEKVSGIEKQFDEMIAILTRIKENQIKFTLELFYQQVDNKKYKSITEDLGYFRSKLREVENNYNKENFEVNINNNEVLEKFKSIMKQSYLEFRSKFSNFNNMFTQFEDFNSLFKTQLEAKAKQNGMLRKELDNPEQLQEAVDNKKTMKTDSNVSKKTSFLLKMKYYNAVLQWDQGQQRLNRLTDFTDRYEFKLNYQVYSGNIFLNYSNRLFIVTGINFNMFYFFDVSYNEVFRLPSLKDNHSRGALVYVEKLNSMLCISGKYTIKCERFSLKDLELKEKSEGGGSISKALSQRKIDYLSNKNLGWEDYPSLNYQRHHASFFIFNHKFLFTFFGYNANRGSIDTIERIDLETNATWQVITYINKNYLNLHLSSHACVYANPEEVYVIGGITDEKFGDKIYKYNFIQNAIYPTKMKIPGLTENEYFRFWEEPTFKSLSSFGNSFSSDDNFTFGMFDARDKLHLFNSRTFQYNII